MKNPNFFDNCCAWIYQGFRDGFGGRVQVDCDIAPLPQCPVLRPPLDANAVATLYSNRYRAASVVIYSLGFLSVVLALAPLVLPVSVSHQAAKILAALEMAFIIVILMFHYYGRSPRRDNGWSSKILRAIGLKHINQGWQEKWSQARLAAEKIRYADLMLCFPGEKLNTLLDEASAAQDGHAGVLLLDAQLDACATVAADDADYVARYRRYFEAQVTGQLAYHRANAARFQHIRHRLHMVADGSFYLTLLACGAHLIWHYPIWSVLAAGLPALGASCHGILASGEFAKLGGQSEKMQAALNQVSAAAGKADTLAELKQLVLHFHHLVISEARGWELMLRGKDVEKA